jgi:hypothetical protein
MRAVLVLPVPLTPAKRKAWWPIAPDTFALFSALAKAFTLASWPTRSASVRGRYLRARVGMSLFIFSPKMYQRINWTPTNIKRGRLTVHNAFHNRESRSKRLVMRFLPCNSE